jgi:hypothetical protein
MSLETLVHLGTFSETSNERDTIYALLNLANDTNSPTQPNEPDVDTIYPMPPSDPDFEKSERSPKYLDTQKEFLGEELFPKIRKWYPQLAPKLTGMLLELDNSLLVALNSDESALRAEVDEVKDVYDDYTRSGENNESSTRFWGKQKATLGAELFPKIRKWQPHLAPKITGMLLELEYSRLVVLNSDEYALHVAVSQAKEVYDEHVKSVFYAGNTGALKRAGSDMLLDYRKSVLEVYRDFVLHCCYHSGSLDIICRPWAPLLSYPRHTAGAMRRFGDIPRPFPSWIASRERLPYGHPSWRSRHRLNANPLVGSSTKRVYNDHHISRACVYENAQKEREDQLYAFGIRLGKWNCNLRGWPMP